MRNYVLLFLLYMVMLSCTKSSKKLHPFLKSPNGKITLQVQTDSLLAYSVKVKGKAILNRSKLGFDLNGIDAGGAFKVLRTKRDSLDETWAPVWGQASLYRNRYNQLKIDLENKSGFKLNIIFRAFDDGVAFRYEFPKQEVLDSILIKDELTEFNFSQNDTVWWTEGNPNTYELGYKKTRLSEIDSANTPITIQGDNMFMSVHEAALIDYSDMRLKRVKGSKLKAFLVPWPDGILVRGTPAMKTPWRTLQIAKDLDGLVSSSLILNLNSPNKLDDTSWIKPMKYVGIWWAMHIGYKTWVAGKRHGANTKNAKKYIDFAAKNGIHGVLYEGWNKGWENWGSNNFFDFVTPYDDFNLEEVMNYAQKNGISVIGHHETGGNIPMYEKNMDTAFKQLKHYKQHVLKMGYAGNIVPEEQLHHGQYMVRHYLKVVKKAAANKIMLNVHEPIKPTGIERTYPNMMTREGARGMEYNGWSKKITPEHTTILPFTRILAGPMDYTPGIFDVLYKDKKRRWHPKDTFDFTRVNTTLAKQMALWVILYSPQQMASDLIENYEGNKAFQFFRDLPVTWDKVKVLDGKIGDFAIIARKHKEDWYVGAITDEKPRNLPLSLDFLDDGNYEAILYEDAEETDYDTRPSVYKIDTLQVTNQTVIRLKLKKSGGAALSIKKIKH